MSETANQTDKITSSITEWVIQCFTRDGDVHTGSVYTTRKEAEASGDRLARINGAEWWLMSRTRVVTVETSPWTRATTTEEPTDD